jgi:hypothetical protein
VSNKDNGILHRIDQVDDSIHMIPKGDAGSVRVR